ncbi:2'-5' RNA ligase family protein [Sediminibacterium sp.]|uniref:2'-5' RNA ligase family protein n=1 Tax=Sediminibacterium sp. TaxID=1917865 RepID=UPI0027329F8B|nr:2'-5' RNA ligase family protein [Sediminibacterium sp.]MDP3567565.1 2'-5' RNA ligase family protein [Sediminibacterium sp.]
MTVKKYFLAIVISEPLFQRIEAVKQDLFLKHGLKGALRSPAHITLHRPFEWKEEKENILIEKLKSFKFKNEFLIELNNYSFFEPRVIYVDLKPNNELFLLHNEIKAFAKKDLRLFNEVNDVRGFHPHITVASRDLKKSNFFELQQEFISKIMSGGFICNSVSLLKLEKKWDIIHNINFNIV